MATIAFFYEVVALLLAVLMLVAFLRGTRGIPTPPEARSKRRGPVTGLSVVVLIEPRVDAEHCVAALLAQTYPKLDIVFVLQRGATLEEVAARRVEADPRARLVHAGDPPVGWTRRNDAFALGARQTDEDYILFMDANMLMLTDGLERALSLAKQRGTDLLTIFPALTATSSMERLLVPFFLQLTLVGVSIRKINDPDTDMAGGFAPFFLFRRAAYDALGGHAGARADRFADSTLAQRVKDRGYRLLVANGTEVAVLQGQSRLRDIWRSWSESFSEAIDGDYRRAGLMSLLVLALFFAPFAVLFWALFELTVSPTPVATSPWLGVVIIGSANIMLALLHRRAMNNLLDLDASLSTLQPVAAVLTAGMIFASALHMEGSWISRLLRSGSGPSEVGSVGASVRKGT